MGHLLNPKTLKTGLNVFANESPQCVCDIISSVNMAMKLKGRIIMRRSLDTLPALMELPVIIAYREVAVLGAISCPKHGEKAIYYWDPSQPKVLNT